MTVQQYHLTSSIVSADNEIRSEIANEIFRNKDFRLLSNIESDNLAFSEFMSEKSGIALNMIKCEIENLKSGVKGLHKLFPCVRMARINSFSYAVRKGRIYLRKLHRIAPIFDIERAKHNLYNLQKFTLKTNFFARLTTLLTTAIFITDQLDCRSINKVPIIQKRLRLLCNCSAYAFHQFRKRLNVYNLFKFEI